MKQRFHALTVGLLALALVAPTAALADRDKDKNKNRKKQEVRTYDPRRDVMRTGRADGETFRIRRSQGGTGRAPVYNRNAPINNDRWRNDRNDRWNDNRWQNNNNRWQTPRQESERRQQTKNEWRNLAIGAGAVAILGLLQNDSRLVFAGAAGALYSAHRYEQDRKSQNKLDRARAHYFSQSHFYRDGKRYDRRVVTQNGQKYYQFVCRD